MDWLWLGWFGFCVFGLVLLCGVVSCLVVGVMSDDMYVLFFFMFGVNNRNASVTN